MSSSQNECDIIVEGFNHSINVHNLKYVKFISDGDSSVYAKIKMHVAYRNEILKIEFSKNILKNYHSTLHKVSECVFF